MDEVGLLKLMAQTRYLAQLRQLEVVVAHLLFQIPAAVMVDLVAVRVVFPVEVQQEQEIPLL